MKNSSWKYPFPTLDDKHFNGNKDGRLDALETAFRDAHLDEINRAAAEQQTKQKTNRCASKYPAEPKACDETEAAETKHEGAQVLLILLAILVLLGGFALAIATEGTMFIKAMILFAAAAIAIKFLKLGGLYR